MRTILAKGRAFAMIVLLCASCRIAHADASCTQLFDRLRHVAAGGQGIHVLWTTNYYAPARDARFLGQTHVNLYRNDLGLDLVGASTRHQVVVSETGKAATAVTERVMLRITRRDQVMLNDTYGPFDPTCAFDKFATITSSDSVEVFSFGQKAVQNSTKLGVSHPRDPDQIAPGLRR